MLLKALLHQTNEIPFYKGKEKLEFESEKLYIVYLLDKHFSILRHKMFMQWVDYVHLMNNLSQRENAVIKCIQ